MESHWDNFGENYELDLTKWMHRYTTEIIFKFSTGIEIDAITSYYNTLILEDNNNNLSEREKEKVKESEHLVHSMATYIEGILLFFSLNKFVLHYVPFIREKANALMENKDYLFDKLHNIIKQRRIEIESTPLDQPLRHDMLTSFITANTPRGINVQKHTDADLLRPITDKEI
jgi:hypothetical protein